MRRPALLTLVWALFAAAAIGVGFGAAGLVGNPFTNTAGDILAGQQSTPAASIASSVGSSSPSSGTLLTRGGQVSASCAGGLVSIGAAPAMHWRLDRIDQGRLPTARLEFTRSGKDGKVEVSAHCVGGTPRFALDDGTASGAATPTATGDDHGGRSPGGSGSDDGGSSGSGGSGGSSGSSGGSGGGRGRG